jgi:hypothetical protein
MLYEGTNEIQAIDLLVRKVIGDNGAALLESRTAAHGKKATARWPKGLLMVTAPGSSLSSRHSRRVA